MSYEGLFLQTLANNISTNFIQHQNIAIGYKKYEFQYNLITIHRGNSFETKITPECLIFNIANNSGATIEALKHFICPLQLNFSIGTIEILKIPLSLLWNLKEPEIIGHKLYLSIPFSLFFGDIHLCGLQQQNITFHLERNSNEDIINYVTGYHLLCKAFLVHANEEGRYVDVSYNIVQQISSILVKVDMDNPGTHSNEFRIRTNMFRGLVKGFFIGANLIHGLEEIQFYINGAIRIDYDKYMIEHMCTKINSNMIYLPLNSDITYDNRGHNSYIGSINIDRIDSSFLNLKFSSPRNQVRIYELTMNMYNQRDGFGHFTHFTYPMQNLVQDFSYHTLRPIEDMLRIHRNENIFNTIIINGPQFDVSLNDLNNDSNIDASSNYISQVLHRVIEDEERNMCPISQLQIQEGERYMLCAGCVNCYNEMDLIQWFQNLNANNRATTCPTCRERWRDYNVYINAVEPAIIEGNVTLTNID